MPGIFLRTFQRFALVERFFFFVMIWLDPEFFSLPFAKSSSPMPGIFLRTFHDRCRRFGSHSSKGSFFVVPGVPEPRLQRRWCLTFAYGFGFMQWKTTGLAASLAAVTYKVCSLALSLQNLNFSPCLLPKRVSRFREFFLEPFTIGADVSARTRRKGLFLF